MSTSTTLQIGRHEAPQIIAYEVIGSLEKSGSEWRTASGIANETGLAVEDVEAWLNNNASLFDIVVSDVKLGSIPFYRARHFETKKVNLVVPTDSNASMLAYDIMHSKNSMLSKIAKLSGWLLTSLIIGLLAVGSVRLFEVISGHPASDFLYKFVYSFFSINLVVLCVGWVILEVLNVSKYLNITIDQSETGYRRYKVGQKLHIHGRGKFSVVHVENGMGGRVLVHATGEDSKLYRFEDRPPRPELIEEAKASESSAIQATP